MSFEKPNLMTESEINSMLAGDYGQFGPLYIYTYLHLLAMGDFSEEEFYNKIDPKLLKSVDEYLVHHAKKYDRVIPENFSEEMGAKIKQASELYEKMLDLINQKAELKELYRVVMEFVRLLGVAKRSGGVTPIEEFEK